MKVMSKDKKKALEEIRRKMIEEGKVVNKETIVDFVRHRVYDPNGYWETKRVEL
jgi:hypothetical protein